MPSEERLDLTEAVPYHHGKFPPNGFDAHQLMGPLSSATAALARYDQMLKGMHDSKILLTPLRRQEAVVSSRMEGTISTLEEVLKYEADQEDGATTSTSRQEAVEVALYARAIDYAQKELEEGKSLSNWIIRNAHKILLSYGRGAKKSPGEYKTEQNYLADRSRRKILFIPISPEHLASGMDSFFDYINTSDAPDLIKAAVSHLEFEALHPFQDGNGRIGRMIITLLLWNSGAINAPHFYISSFFEDNKDEYISRMREVSSSGDWTPWIAFFLKAVEAQATKNLMISEEIRLLYARLRDEMPNIISSKWNARVLDFLFERPIFRSNVFPKRTGIPQQSANRFIRALVQHDLVQTLEPASGRRPALYSFGPLLDLVRE
ncbi:Filamentation induced by cAMP protein Fic [Stappia sp. 22II-S9-Z10]|nr:Filamentation induced by cAMP protein Fic [Stappia sp. 22II-S9-Z10]